jgi:hypothetical protein
LLNDESEKILDRIGKYPYKFGRCRVEDLSCPEQVIVHPEEDVLQEYEKLGFIISHKSYGTWLERKTESELYQDMIISTKPD